MRIPSLILALALTGCASQPIQPPKVVEVVVTKLVPVPAELSRDCEHHAPKAKTVAEAVRLANLRKAALDECSTRMAKIRSLAK